VGSSAARSRIRFGLETQEGFRPLLGISVSNDGGLMLDLSGYAPLDLFRYGVVDIPTEAGPHTVPARQGASDWGEGVTPKVHYHRSGELSVNATGRLERFKLRGTPLKDIRNHRHTFIFMARVPLSWAVDDRRSSDAAFRVEGVLDTLTVNGYIGNTADLREPHASNPENPFGIDVVHKDGSVVPTLIARLGTQDLEYYLWLELYANRPFTGGEGPAVLLHAFDPVSAQDTATPTETIAAWAVSA
jgi:hypothetical protein